LLNTVINDPNNPARRFLYQGYQTQGGSQGQSQTNIVEGPITNNLSTTVFWAEQFLLNVPYVCDGGRVVGPTNGWYQAGTNLLFEAIPNVYYSFDGWTGQTNTTANPLPVTLTTPWTNLTAHFSMLVTSQGTPHLWYASHGITNDFEWHDTHDLDGDGKTGKEEYIWGTHPANPLSDPTIYLAFSNGITVVTFPYTTNTAVYSLFGRENLTEGRWTEITNSIGANGELIFPITTTNRTFFFRGAARLQD